MTDWAYNVCRWCQMRLASDGCMLCTECAVAVEAEIQRMTGAR